MQALSSLTKWSLILIIGCSILALVLLFSQMREQSRSSISSTAVSAPHWSEVESALAHQFLPEGIQGLCEWEVLGQTMQDVFVWALCEGNSSGSGPVGMSAPAVIHLATDGHIQTVTVPRDGALYSQDVKVLFPIQLRERIFAYTLTPQIEGHLQTRLAHPDMPPLIALTATPSP